MSDKNVFITHREEPAEKAPEKRRESRSIFSLFRQLWYKLKWRTSERKKAEDTLRPHIRAMLKGGTMHELGGRLRLNQQIGKMKHEAKMKVQK